ncbi:MAG: DUF4382 domain-containing protein [Nanoarchaeota archaeon]|nr:DUF4382 domain-containing protein [Nanoarchaeota archaeon]
MFYKKAQIGTVFVVLVLILIIAGGIYFYKNSYNVSEKKEDSSEAKGRVVFAITDAAANMNGVSKVLVTVDKVSVQGSTNAWVDVSTSPKSYDLLELKSQGSLAVIADMKLEEGNYNQMRLDVSKVIIVDSEGEHEAKLPSNEIKINGDIEVNNESTATVTFDFIADESIHVTGNNKYIFAPVIKVETRENANVENKGSGKVEISGGEIKSDTKVAMNAEGKVGVGFEIAQDAEIDIGVDGLIKVGKGKVNSSAGTGTNIELGKSKISGDLGTELEIEY